MIPKIIWQTYEDDFNILLPETKECIDTWINKNPEWKHMYMNAKEREEFVLREFGKEWHQLFNNCKLGVVKANIWRCMIIYTYGGVYADLDTKCNISIDQWIKNDYTMTLSRDDDGNPDNFAIHTFAGQPKNKLLELILNQLKNNIKNNVIDKNNVIELSGETVWSNILTGQEDRYKIYCYDKGSNMFNDKAVTHFGVFKNWHNRGYKQWTKE
jgi:mannosyltransferase OCH1-like enzyme